MKKKLLLITAMAFVLCMVLAFSVFAADSVPASGRLGTNTIVEGIALPTVIDTDSQIEMDDGLIYPSFYFFKDQTTTAWDFSKVKNEEGNDKYTIDNIVKLEIPHGITNLSSLGYRDQNKTTLTHVRIPNTINSNNWSGGFRTTKSLTSVEFEEGYSYKIFESMFNSCPVSNFVIPEGVTSIDKESMCQMGLTTITIPDSVTYIGGSAFTGNSQLKEVIISPNSKLEKIDYRAFAGLSGLTEPFYFPSSLKTLGSSAFSSSYNVSAFLNLENTQITVLDEGVFYECYKFTNIALPSTLTTINQKAFNKCIALETVTFNGNNLTTIGNFAFAGCSKLQSIEVPESVTSFGGDMFNSCSSLKSATLPSGLTTIPYYTFYNCKSLEQFYMSDNVTYIGQYAFYNCEKLGPVYLSNNIETLYSNGTGRQGVFQNCKNMYFVNNPGDTEKPDIYFLPDSLTEVGSASLKNCKNLNTTIVFPVNFTNLDDDGWNFGNKDGAARNFVFLGVVNELKFANENYNTNFYFVNPQVTCENLTLTYVQNPTNCFAFVCSDGKVAKLGSEIVWTEEGYSHITNPNGRRETPATCTMPKMVADYCFCGKFIEGTETTEGVALGHNYTGTVTYSFTTANKEGSKCTVCINNCGIDNVEVIPPVYVELGFSTKTFGKDGYSFTNGYEINRESLVLYQDAKNVTLKFGFAFNLASSFTNNEEITLDDFAVKANVANQTSDINFRVHEFVVTYGNSDNLDTNIIIGAFVVENDGENDSIYFINRADDITTGVNGFDAVSYNYIKTAYGDAK
ncbi:MAG: hypothetical protein E7596_03495 [Ruminococcaceae bacterium]|nr:hypothetical protein [Oscillospiraceae bacterium]